MLSRTCSSPVASSSVSSAVKAQSSGSSNPPAAADPADDFRFRPLEMPTGQLRPGFGSAEAEALTARGE